LAGGSIEVMAQWGGPEQAGFEEVLAAFTEETGIEVTYISERDLTQVLPTRIAGGNPPDLAMISRPGQIQEFILDEVAFSYAELGVDLDAIQDSYAQSVLDLGTFDGELYGLLTASNSKSTFWYKPASFEEQGFAEPETWDDLMAIVDGYVDAGKTPLSIGGLDGWTLTDWFENLYVRVAGPENYVKLFVTHEIEWTDPTVVQTMERFRDIVSPTDEKLAGGAAGANSTGFIDAWDLVLSDQAEMYYEGGFMGNFARENFPDLEGGTDYTFFPFPEIDPAYGKPVVGGGDFAIAFTNRPETAAFIDFLASSTANEVWAQAEAGARITPNRNVSADLFADPLTGLEAATIKSADIFVFDGSDLAPSAVGGDAMFTGLQQFIENPDDIDGVLEFIENAADGAY
jgi:alpha-glucoside transport system substrate-binding protein